MAFTPQQYKVQTYSLNICNFPQRPIEVNCLSHRQQHIQRIRLRTIRNTFSIEPLNRSGCLINLPGENRKYR